MYASDLSEAQWCFLEPLLLESSGRRSSAGRRRKYSLRSIVDGVLYVLRTGCQWRQLPTNFPPWQTVYQQFRLWRLSGAWERVCKTLRERQRKSHGRNSTPSVAIVDSQSVKTVQKGGSAVTMRARRSRAASGTLPSTRRATC